MTNFVDGTEGGADFVRSLAARALALRDGAVPRRFEGKRVGAVFLNPSLRTRTSLEAACGLLGAQPIVVQPGLDAWGWAFGDGVVMNGAEAEHAKDALGVLSSYVDVLAVRSFASLTDREADAADTVLSAACRYAKTPVVNLESALWHPLQGLADTATWLHHLGNPTGRKLTLTWAPHPKALPTAVANQVLLSAALQGMDVTVAHPEGFDLPPFVVERAKTLAAAGGGGVKVTHDRDAAFDGAEIVVAKSWSGWSGYEDRDGESARRAALAHWRVDAAAMARTREARFMHCLPVRRNVVVTDDVIDGPLSAVQDEASLRLWTAASMLEALLGKEGPWSA